jgi:hypothetical protein
MSALLSGRFTHAERAPSTNRRARGIPDLVRATWQREQLSSLESNTGRLFRGCSWNRIGQFRFSAIPNNNNKE